MGLFALASRRITTTIAGCEALPAFRIAARVWISEVLNNGTAVGECNIPHQSGRANMRRVLRMTRSYAVAPVMNAGGRYSTVK